MNDHDLDLALADFGVTRVQPTAPPSLREHIRSMPLSSKAERRWLPQSPKWRFPSMFSATKFVVAGAIVALFGGFLLSGVLTQQPSDDRLSVGVSASATTQAEPTDAATSEPEPTDEPVATRTTTDLLPGVDLVTEEVEPGVYRVDSDGDQDLTRVVPREELAYADAYDGRDATIGRSRIVAGLDGSVWILQPEGYIRLGQEDMEAPRGTNTSQLGEVEVGPDGRLWSAAGGPYVAGRLRSWDGDRWTVHRRLPKNRQVRDVAILPDGTVWAAWDNEPNAAAKVGRLDGDEWEVLPGRVVNPNSDRPAGLLLGGGDVVVTDDLIWILPGEGNLLQYHNGERWRAAERPGGRALEMAGDVGGTIWLRLYEGCDASTSPDADACTQPLPSDSLARYDGDAWTLYDAADGVPVLDSAAGPLGAYPGFFEVDPAGRAWFNRLEPWLFDDDGEEVRPWAGCTGITSFDGSTFQDYLMDQCIWSLDIGADGSVWLLASENEPDPDATTDAVNVYVITPEAVAEPE